MKIDLYKNLHCLTVSEGMFSVDIIKTDYDSLLSDISTEYKPEEIYPDDVLDDWAIDNGYVKADK